MAIPLIMLTLLLPVRVAAHDIWLLPERFTLEKGDTLVVHQQAGNELDSELELPLMRHMTPRFELLTPVGSVDLLRELQDAKGLADQKPLLERQLDVEGLGLLTLEHGFIYHGLKNEKFLEYLQHEEVPPGKFRDQLEQGAAQTERYTRMMKCLIRVGQTATGDLYKRVLGQKIELVLLQNPYLLDPGDELEVQVLFNGEPLRDKRVVAFNRDRDRAISTFKARTNTHGIARFTLVRSGVWLLRLVHLMPCSESPDRGCDVNWESYWTSFSFELD